TKTKGWPAVRDAAVSAYKRTKEALGTAFEWTKTKGWPAVRDAAVSAYKRTKEALGNAVERTKTKGWPGIKEAAENAFKNAREFCSSKISAMSKKFDELHDKAIEKIDKYLDDYLTEDKGLLLSSPANSSPKTSLSSSFNEPMSTKQSEDNEMQELGKDKEDSKRHQL
ncbi:rtx repeat protein, partial [Legionella cincinnatiensis]